MTPPHVSIRMSPEFPVMEHSKEFVADVVADDAIQRMGGDALWNTITYSVRPGLASLLAGVGVAFVGIGVFALGRGGYMEDDKIVGKVVKGVGNWGVGVWRLSVGKVEWGKGELFGWGVDFFPSPFLA